MGCNSRAHSPTAWYTPPIKNSILEFKIALMKNFLVLLLLVFSTGCGLHDRELELEKGTGEVNRKEQELLLKERSLQIKAEELAQKEKMLDSTAKSTVDSFFTQHPQLPGKWNVAMHCTETTCSGSAVGDIKNEQWEITYEGKVIIAKAFANDKLVRIYTGSNNGNAVELSTEQDNPDPALSTKMIVRFQEIKENEIQGEREIIRPDNCHITYSLELKKQ